MGVEGVVFFCDFKKEVLSIPINPITAAVCVNVEKRGDRKGRVRCWLLRGENDGVSF